MKTLLALGAGRLNVPALREMASVVRVIAVDRDPYISINEQNLRTVKLDFSNPKELLRIAHLESIDGVYPFNDHAIRPAGLLVRNLGLIGLKDFVAENYLDKSRMRDLWRKANLNQPKYFIVRDLITALDAAEKIGYPLIIKPAASGGGGRGVFSVHNSQELTEVFPTVVEQNKYSENILIEEYIDGVESSLEIVIAPGVTKILAISTKKKSNSRSQVATEIIYPGVVSGNAKEKIKELCISASKALGMKQGVAHFEVITSTNDEPYLVEVGARAGGGHTFHPIVSHVSGKNYPKIVAHLYTNDLMEMKNILDRNVHERAAVYAFPISELTGRITDINFRSISQEAIIELWKSKNEIINGLNSSMDRLGCVVVMGEERIQVVKLSQEIMEGFSVNISSI